MNMVDYIYSVLFGLILFFLALHRLADMLKYFPDKPISEMKQYFVPLVLKISVFTMLAVGGCCIFNYI